MLKVNKKGLAWLEIIIIIAVLIVVFVLARIGINNAQVKSRDIERVAGVKQIQNALEFYFYHRNRYPVLENAVLGASDFKLLCDTDSGFQTNNEGCVKIYLEEISPAPTPPAENAYVYNNSDGQNYKLTFILEKGVGGLAAGEHIATPTGME